MADLTEATLDQIVKDAHQSWCSFVTHHDCCNNRDESLDCDCGGSAVRAAVAELRRLRAQVEAAKELLTTEIAKHIFTGKEGWLNEARCDECDGHCPMATGWQCATRLQLVSVRAALGVGEGEQG